MRALVAFVRLGRPLFLGGGFLLYALGATIAAATGHALDWHRYALGQAAVTAFQWMTHYANEYFDYDADVANATPTAYSGGSRVLANGELSRKVALIAALVLFSIGAGISILVVREDRDALAILVAIAVLAWAYSGLGEIDTALVMPTPPFRAHPPIARPLRPPERFNAGGDSHRHGVRDADGGRPVLGHTDGNVANCAESLPLTLVALRAHQRRSWPVRTGRSTCSNAALAPRRGRCRLAIGPGVLRRRRSIG